MRATRVPLLVAALVVLTANPSAAEVQLTLKDGKVWLTATAATTREILAEWARVGQTRVVNGERVTGPPVTLLLVGVPESEALDIVLRSVGGYIAAPRRTAVADASRFDRLLIIPSTARPRAASAAPATATFAAAPPASFDFSPVDDQSLADRIEVVRQRAEEALRAGGAVDGLPVPDPTPGVFSVFPGPETARPAEPAPADEPPASRSTIQTRPNAPAGVAVPGMIVPAPSSQRPGQNR